MRKENKIKTIVKAFTEDADVSEEVLKHRRDICKGCPFNSDNVKDFNLGFIDKARKKVLKGKPFCTACGCQIEEKTSRGIEECGLATKGKKPKWNRVSIETLDKLDLDIVNNSYKDVNIKISNNNKFFEVDYGEINKKGIKGIELLFKSKSSKEFDLKYIKASCNVCTYLNSVKLNYTTYKITINLNTSLLNGDFSKNVYFGYKIGDDYKKNKIVLKGKIKEDEL